jgi:hypothetical protein
MCTRLNQNSYSTKTAFGVTLQTESSYNWEAEQ